MKATELIKRLQELVDEYGDHPVELATENDRDEIKVHPYSREMPWTLLSS